MPIPDGSLRAQLRGRRPCQGRQIGQVPSECPQAREGGAVPQGCLRIHHGRQENQNDRRGRGTHQEGMEGRGSDNEDCLRLCRKRPDRGLFGEGHAQKAPMEDCQEVQAVHGQGLQRQVSPRKARQHQREAGVRTLGGRPSRRPQGRHQRRLHNPPGACDEILRDDKDTRQEVRHRAESPPLIPGHGREGQVQVRLQVGHLRQRDRVCKMAGDGAGAWNGDLFRKAVSLMR